VFIEANPRLFALLALSVERHPDRRSHRGRKRLRSLPFSSAVFLLTDHCQLTCPDPVGDTVHSSAVLPSPAPASGPQVLLLSKLKAPINHAESTLLQVLILKQLKVPLESITFEKQGEGSPLWLTNCSKKVSVGKARWNPQHLPEIQSEAGTVRNGIGFFPLQLKIEDPDHVGTVN
jgi:hypothetical protein